MAFFRKALALTAKKKGLKKAPRGKAAARLLVGAKAKRKKPRSSRVRKSKAVRRRRCR